MTPSFSLTLAISIHLSIYLFVRLSLPFESHLSITLSGLSLSRSFLICFHFLCKHRASHRIRDGTTTDNAIGSVQKDSETTIVTKRRGEKNKSDSSNTKIESKRTQHSRNEKGGRKEAKGNFLLTYFSLREGQEVEEKIRTTLNKYERERKGEVVGTFWEKYKEMN